MIYVVTSGQYSDAYMVALLDGPEEPGMHVLAYAFDEMHGAPPMPDIGLASPSGSRVENKAEWDHWQEVWTDYRAARHKALKPKFKGYEYETAFVQWLCDTHGYREIEYGEHWADI